MGFRAITVSYVSSVVQISGNSKAFMHNSLLGSMNESAHHKRFQDTEIPFRTCTILVAILSLSSGVHRYKVRVQNIQEIQVALTSMVTQI